MSTTPAAHPREFRDDVIAVARRGDASIAQIAKDFGISESYLRNWLAKADVEDGVRPGVTGAENADLREARRKIRLLEQENEVLRRAADPSVGRRTYRFRHDALLPALNHSWGKRAP